MSDNGFITIASHYSAHETIERLAAIVTAKGMTIFARIDHADNAVQAGLELRPTELLLFGNPNVGTLLMQDQQTIGIDLPLKALAWEDSAGQVWLAYNDAAWLATRHGLGDKSAAAIKAIAAALATVTHAAAVKDSAF